MAAPAPEELEAGGARVRARYPRKDDFKAAELTRTKFLHGLERSIGHFMGAKKIIFLMSRY